jgi:hypothetical protein
MSDALKTADRGLSKEDHSKDFFFDKVGALADEMSAAHGKDFAMGVLILAARFLAEGRKLTSKNENSEGIAKQ